MSKALQQQVATARDAGANPGDLLQAILRDKYSSDVGLSRWVLILLAFFMMLVLPAVAALLFADELADVPWLSGLSKNSYLPTVTAALASFATLFLGKLFQLHCDKHKILAAQVMLLTGDVAHAVEVAFGSGKQSKLGSVLSAAAGVVSPS
ncbi:MAG: hypothetical protein SGJ21_16840 [Alphaproteobacteria bacterium]|nr:hypothetical protein [Alphaproteobacteria bacterium]